MKKVVSLFFSALLILVLFSCAKHETQYLERYLRAFESYAHADFEAPSLQAAFKDSERFYPSCLLKGKVEFFTGKLEAAIKTFRQALKLQTTSVDARVWLARALLSRNEPASSEEAKRLLLEAVQADSENIAAHSLLARYCRDSHDEVSQREHLERILLQSSAIGSAFLERAKLLWIAGSADKAIADLDSALALFDAGSEEAQAALKIKRRIIAYEGTKP